MDQDKTCMFQGSEKCDDGNKITLEVIVDYYLHTYRRELSYGVCFRDNYRYCSFTNDELEIIRKCSQTEVQDLEEILKSEGYSDLVDDIHSRCDMWIYDDDDEWSKQIVSVDYEDPQPLTKISYCSFDKNGVKVLSGTIEMPLSDEDFTILLVKHIMHQNKFAMNDMLVEFPELASRVLDYLYCERPELQHCGMPFIFVMEEVRNACEAILNPFEDCLALFNNEDQEVRDLAMKYQVYPGLQDEIALWWKSYTNGVNVKFVGTNMVFSAFMDMNFPLGWIFTVSAYKVMERFNLKTPEEIFPYLAEHYSCDDNYDKLRRVLLEPSATESYQDA